MTTRKAKINTYGTTTDGTPITDELVQRLADEAEAGYDVNTLRRRGRPIVGTERAEVSVQVRMGATLHARAKAKARGEHVTVSEITRRALDAYLAS